MALGRGSAACVVSIFPGVMWQVCFDLLRCGGLEISFPWFRAVKRNCAKACGSFPGKLARGAAPLLSPQKVFLLSASKNSTS